MTYLNAGVIRGPGDEGDLVAVEMNGQNEGSSVSCARGLVVPGTLAGGVLEVVDGVPGALALSTLNPVSHCSSSTRIGRRTQDSLNA